MVKHKWFDKLQDHRQEKIMNYLDRLGQIIKDDRLKIETMMNKTKYTYEFCEECVEAWKLRRS